MLTCDYVLVGPIYPTVYPQSSPSLTNPMSGGAEVERYAEPWVRWLECRTDTVGRCSRFVVSWRGGKANAKVAGEHG